MTGSRRTETEAISPLAARTWAAVARGAGTSREIADALGCSLDTAQRGVTAALDAGLIGCGYSPDGERLPRSLHVLTRVVAHG